jgi:hypothetical protein
MYSQARDQRGPAQEEVEVELQPGCMTSRMELRLVVPGGTPLPVPADVIYDPADPYAVRVAFHTGGDECVEWTFARSLLTEGVSQAAGMGDVQVWPARSGGRRTVCVSLSSPSGRALFEASLPDVVQFLTRTYSLVPTGNESDYVDVDSELALLLSSEG